MPPKVTLKLVLLKLMMAMVITRTTESAFRIFKKLQKSLKLKINVTNTLEVAPLGSEWFMEREINPQTGAPTYLLRSVVIMTQGVFIKKFPTSWLNLDTKLAANLQMGAIFYSKKDNLITAYQMNRNDFIITIAFEDLSLMFVNLKRSDEGRIVKTKNDIFDLNLKFKVDLPEARIRSIGLIPYTGLIIVAPHRFSMYKIHRVSGEVVQKQRPSLDETRLIVMPVPSHKPYRDPYSPFYSQVESVSRKKHALLTSCTTFLMTSHIDDMISFVDWTSLKTYLLYPARRFYQTSYKAGASIIHSACFFGGLPSSQLYLMTPSYGTNSILAISGLYRDVVGYREVGYNPKKMELTWLYATNYVFVLMLGLEDQGEQVYQVQILDFGPFQYEGNRFKNIKGKSMIVSDLSSFREFKHINLISFTLSPEIQRRRERGVFEEKRHLDFYDELDRVYLLSYLDDAATYSIVPPFFNWETCHEGPTGSQQPDKIMLYGRFRHCKNCSRGLQQFKDLVNKTKNSTYVNCKPPKCESFQKPVILFRFNQELNESTISTKCTPKYSINITTERDANDDQCPPGFSEDQYGVCRNCYQGAREGIPLSLKNSTFSDCEIFNYFTLVDGGILNSFYLYTKEKFEDFDFSKGAKKGNKFYKEEMFVDPLAPEGTESVNHINTGLTFAIADSKTSDYKKCYEIVTDPTNSSKYSILTVNGYFLEQISPDGTGPGASQIGLYSEEGEFNKFYCKKFCDLGSYYNFETISCRKCDFGCAECQTLELCKKCEAGLRLRVHPNHLIHKIGFDDSQVGRCGSNCQIGYFVSAFDGACQECADNCFDCRDYSFWKHREFLATTGRAPGYQSYCLKCNETDGKGNPLYLSTSTGQCVAECSGLGVHPRVVSDPRTGRLVRYCVVCLEPRCSDCRFNDTLGCTKCFEPFVLDGSGGCAVWGSTGNGRFLLVGGFVFIGFFVLTYSILLLSNRTLQKRKRQYQKANGKEEDQKKGKELVKDDEEKQKING